VSKVTATDQASGLVGMPGSRLSIGAAERTSSATDGPRRGSHRVVTSGPDTSAAPQVPQKSTTREERRIVDIGLLNIMPEAAFAETDAQFTNLVTASSPATHLRIHRFSLPSRDLALTVPDELARGYRPLEALFDTRMDALLVSGTEPMTEWLVDEPSWEPLSQVIAWALDNTVSTVLSCLAAHVAALLLDGVDRYRLPTKCFGVVSNRTRPENSLSRGLPEHFTVPHSHQNTVDLDKLLSVGYNALLSTESEWSAVTRTIGDCLLVLYQGHPEYGRLTLLREYRRDLRRFRQGTLAIPPSPPSSYFDESGRMIVDPFDRATRGGAEPEYAQDFPFERLSAHCPDTWADPSRRLYQNWVQSVAERVYERTGERPGASS
jgi:homoserine O-succinyltransferase/O-acetyltransferase